MHKPDLRDSYSVVIGIPQAEAAWSLGICTVADAVTVVDFISQAWSQPPYAPTPFAKEIVRQFNAYFFAGTPYFSLPLAPSGSEFQQRVWQQLRQIPYGQSVTYGRLAHHLGSSARAVGGACRRNPIPLLVPCHRVVAAAGLGGFSGHREGPMLRLKGWLLALERAAGRPLHG